MAGPNFRNRSFGSSAATLGPSMKSIRARHEDGGGVWPSSGMAADPFHPEELGRRATVERALPDLRARGLAGPSLALAVADIKTDPADVAEAWVHRARMAHARRLAGVENDKLDELAMRMHPEFAPVKPNPGEADIVKIHEARKATAKDGGVETPSSGATAKLDSKGSERARLSEPADAYEESEGKPEADGLQPEEPPAPPVEPPTPKPKAKRSKKPKDPPEESRDLTEEDLHVRHQMDGHNAMTGRGSIRDVRTACGITFGLHVNEALEPDSIVTAWQSLVTCPHCKDAVYEAS